MTAPHPIDYAERPNGGHCGVLAVAICAGVTFEAAWNLMKVGRRSNWDGGTRHPEREAALQALDVPFLTYQHVPAKHLQQLPPAYVEKHRYLPGCTLATFAKRHAQPATLYMIRVKGHVVTLRDGMVTDQSGIVPVADHWCGKRRVSHSTVIGETI